jgi:4-hydroxybenzoate polyprenyltransferase
MFTGFVKVAHFVRWRDWAPGKIPIFCTLLAYIALANNNFSASFTIRFIIFIIFASLHSALGYVVNDLGDIKIDRLHGKSNAFENLNFYQGIGALAVIIILAFISGLPFVEYPMFIPLWIGWLFFSFAYSIKPLRLKERGTLGLGVSALAQWTLPILLTFAAMERFGGWDMIIFAVTSTISGSTLEIAHQRFDRSQDMGTQTTTFGTKMRSTVLDRLYMKMIFLDKLALGAVLFIITVCLVKLKSGMAGIVMSFPLLSTYIVLFSIALFETLRSSSIGNILDPYYSSKRSANKLLHETMPNLVVPGYLLLLLMVFQPVNGILFLVFLYWRIVLGQADLQGVLRAVLNVCLKRN